MYGVYKFISSDLLQASYISQPILQIDNPSIILSTFPGMLLKIQIECFFFPLGTSQRHTEQTCLLLKIEGKTNVSRYHLLIFGSIYVVCAYFLRLTPIPKSRYYKEKQVDRKKRKAIRWWFVSIRHGRHVLSQCPKQRQSPPGNIKKCILLPGGNTSV